MKNPNNMINSHLECSYGEFKIKESAAYSSISDGKRQANGNPFIFMKSSKGWHNTNHSRHPFERRGWASTMSNLSGQPQQPNNGFGIVKEKQGCLPSVKAFPPKCNTQLVYGKGRRDVDLFFCTNHR